MKRLFLPVMLIAALCACAAAPQSTVPQSTVPQPSAAPSAAPTPDSALTLEQEVGQLVIVRPDALELTLAQETINDAKADGVTELTDAMRDALRTYPVGGICQFGKNITDPEQIKRFNNDLQAACQTPLFIAVDEEGGRHGAGHRRLSRTIRLQYGLCPRC